MFLVRGQRVILDTDLAAIYDVPTFRFNEAIKRNQQRLPEDFAFQLTAKELTSLRSQIMTSSLQPANFQNNDTNRSQSVTSSEIAEGDSSKILTLQFVISRLEPIDN